MTRMSPKHKTLTLLSALALLVLALPTPPLHAVTTSETFVCEAKEEVGERNLLITMVGNSSSGAFVAATTTSYNCAAGSNVTGTVQDFISGWYLYGVQVVPQFPAPTAAYDATLTDQYSMDIMGGKLADLSATAAADITPLLDTTNTIYRYPKIRGPLTLTLTNNSVGGAKTLFILRLLKP